MRRRDLLVLAVSPALLSPIASRAQPKAMPVVGWLHSLSADRSEPVVAAFHEGLRQAGYIDGRNIAIEFRWADGDYDRLPSLAADLAGRKLDVILTGGGTNPIVAAKKATSTIPIVFTLATDPVGDGLVASLPRPGGNVTGISIMGLELVPKRLELLSELVPAAKTFGLLVNPNSAHTARQIPLAQQAASIKGMRLHILKASGQDEIDAAFATLSQLLVEALVIGDDAFFYNQRDQIAALETRYSVPASYALRGHVLAGGLSSYGTSLVGLYRQSAGYIARVLAGAKPADLPVEQPTKFELVINLKTAKPSA